MLHFSQYGPSFCPKPLFLAISLVLLSACSTGALHLPGPLLDQTSGVPDETVVIDTENGMVIDVDGRVIPLVQSTVQEGADGLSTTRVSPTPGGLPGQMNGVVDRVDRIRLDDRTASIRLNVEDVALPAFINEVFGNILGLPFEIASNLKTKQDKVTVRLEQPQTQQMVYNVTQQVLLNYGVEIVKQGDMLRFQVKQTGLDPDEPPILISGSARPEVPVAYRPVFQFVPLHNVDTKDVIPWLTSAYDKSGLTVAADRARSGIMLKGMASIVQQAAEAARLLDQPFMRGRFSVRIDPAFITAGEMAEQLKTVITAQGFSASINDAAGSIVLVPLESSNGLIVFANEGRLVQMVQEWARQIDRLPLASAMIGQGDGKDTEGLFYYEVKNTRATELATTLRSLVSGLSGSGAFGITGGLRDSASQRAAEASTRTGRDRDMRPNRPAGGGVAPLIQAASAAALVSGSMDQNPLLDSLASNITGSGTIVEDENRNAILFRGSSRTWQQMQPLIQQMDKPARQVLIEVTIARIDLNDSEEYGLSWKFMRGSENTNAGIDRGSSISGTGPLEYVLNTAGGTFARLTADAQAGRARILATPRVMVKSGEQANINVGSDIPIITTQSPSSSNTEGTSDILQNITYRSTGIILNVSPVVYSNNRIDLSISQEVSGDGQEGGGDSQNLSPSIGKTSLETSLTLKSGGSILMGGLIRESIDDSRRGIPWLKDIPLIGYLFSTGSVEKTRSEVVLLIQPYVIETDREAKEITDKFKEMISASLQCDKEAGRCVNL